MERLVPSFILIKIALLLLVVWIIAMVALDEAGDWVHVPLFLGLILLVVGARKALEGTPAAEDEAQGPSGRR